jgi:uncharacterized protein (TIGR03118 family)
MTASARGRILAVLATAAVAAVAGGAAIAGHSNSNSYTVHPLVTDAIDPALVNPWGLVAGPTSPWWVSDNATGLSTLYDGSGTKIPLNVTTATANPTGTVFNLAGAGFVVSNGSTSGSSVFLFDGEDGIISGWNPGVDRSAAQVAVSDPDAVYKGLAYAMTPTGARLYAADFHGGTVDVLDSNWAAVATAGGFVDPSLPRGYAPFGIQAISGRVFVAFAKQDAAAHDEVPGEGRGFVDAFDTEGRLLARVARRGPLNAPWGLALAPASFGRFGGDLLVGNFGDGTINAYREMANGRFEHRGRLRAGDESPVRIDGLWALEFGLSQRSGGTDTLFFTAGPGGEQHGLFGSITPNATGPGDTGEDSGG